MYVSLKNKKVGVEKIKHLLFLNCPGEFLAKEKESIYIQHGN